MDVKEAEYVAKKVNGYLESIKGKEYSEREKAILQMYSRAKNMYDILEIYKLLRGFKLIEGCSIA